MGHRALVAYERPDETYNLHYSHWGGCNLRLKHNITETTPFGGPEADHPWVRQVFDHLQTTQTTGLPDVAESSQPSLGVDPEPWAVGITFDAMIADHLDYLAHEAFYVVSRSFEVTAYRTFWLGFSTEATSVAHSPTVGHGVLCTVRWYDKQPVNDGYLRGWFDGTKAMVAAFIDRGLFTESQATTYLLERLLAQVDTGAEYHLQRMDR